MRSRWLIGLVAVAIGACGTSRANDAGDVQTPVPAFLSDDIDKLDLLVMVDNSGSMRENQSNLLAQLNNLVIALTTPPCVSQANPTQHTCDPLDPMDGPAFVPVRDMHVGIVDSDLGTPGSSVPGCSNSDLGDDGLLNPIRNGQSTSHHEPWVVSPPTFGRPTDCMDPNEFPSFIEFDSSTSAAAFTHDFQCNAGLYVGGCGLESQLDAVYRGLIIHDARDTPGNMSPNAGFLREDALLAIVMLTDEEDGSVRDCRFANGTPCDGAGAIDVYNPASTDWASMELNLRFYMYQPCGPQDPTWPMSRYLDPAAPSSGLLALKPGHPERVIFAAITGVPLNIPMRAGSTDVDWDQLLGAPGPNGPDDFCGRDTSRLANVYSPEGPVSMQQANADLHCAQRVVPACRRQGSTYSATACTTDLQYFAWPGRRIAELARRFDESPLCNGAPCHNGIVSSICQNNYADPIQQIIAKIRSRLTRRCLLRPLATMNDSNGNVVASCVIREIMPAGEDSCDPARGLRDPTLLGQFRVPSHVTLAGSDVRRVCQLDQLATDAVTHRPLDGVGWYYSIVPEPSAPGCDAHLSFTVDATPEPGASVRMECTAL